jgi:hypothetical protein
MHLEEFFEKSSRDDKPEPPMGHPPRDDGNRAGGHAALPASRLREVNRILENTAWGSYRTEFYPTCDTGDRHRGAREGAVGRR